MPVNPICFFCKTPSPRPAKKIPYNPDFKCLNCHATNLINNTLIHEYVLYVLFHYLNDYTLQLSIINNTTKLIQNNQVILYLPYIIPANNLSPIQYINKLIALIPFQ